MADDYWPVRPGWQWRVYRGGRTSDEPIVGGWAPTEDAAEAAIRDELEEDQ